MRILITNQHLDAYAGSELYTYSLAKELKKRGHEIMVYSPVSGRVSAKLQQYEIAYVDDLGKIADKKFDVIHAQHNVPAILARSVFHDTPMLFMSHGVLPELEQPPSVDLGIGHYLVVSEQSKQHLIERYKIPPELISITRNFVDLDRFKAKKTVAKVPHKVLVLSNHYTEKVRQPLEAVSEEMGFHIEHVGMPENPVENVEDYINQADLVVTLGRGALEAMACERNVLILDVNGGDGMLTPANFAEIRKYNLSGRRYGIEASTEWLKAEISKYNPAWGQEFRALIQKEYGAEVLVLPIIKIYEKLAKEKSIKSQIKPQQLYNELEFLARYYKEANDKGIFIADMRRVFDEKETYIHKIKTDLVELKAKMILEEEQAINKVKKLQQKQKTENLETAAKIQELNKVIEDKERHICNLEPQYREFQVVKQSFTYKFLLIHRKISDLLIFKPLRFLKDIPLAVRLLHREGLRVFIKVTKLYFRGELACISTEKIVTPAEQYQIYLREHALDKAKLNKIIKNSKAFLDQPKISIITPVYNVAPKWLDKCIESVLAQVYENWELCLHDDASTHEDTVKCLRKWEKKDRRIRVSYGRQNQHISGASNEALKLATGEFIALLDNDDELTQDALYEVVRLLNEHPEADFIYSDEDKIDGQGKLLDPFFKPDWSPDLMLSIMYTCHLGVYRKSIIDNIGGFRKGYEGAQDYDLVLRFIEKTDSRKILHTPKVLYHWRVLPGSTAYSASSKDYADCAAQKALVDYANRNNIQAEILEGPFKGSYRIKRLIDGKAKVSIIIPFKDKVDMLKKCLKSIQKKTHYKNYEIILVDNNSKENETKKYLKKIEKGKIKILPYPHRFNFSALNNYAVRHCSGEYILFLNNDTEAISDNWLEAMVEQIQRPEVGAVGAKLIYGAERRNTIQHAGVVIGIGGIAGHAFRHFPYDSLGYIGQLSIIKNYSAVTGACLLTKRIVFNKVGGFNDKELAVSYNDVDFCLKLRELGYLIVYTPYAELYHFESVSRGYDECFTNTHSKEYKRVMAERTYMTSRWDKYIKYDPYYNPNLTLNREDFSIEIL